MDDIVMDCKLVRMYIISLQQKIKEMQVTIEFQRAEIIHLIHEKCDTPAELDYFAFDEESIDEISH